MKKFLALALAMVMIFALCACGQQAAAPAEPEAEATSAEVKVETTEDKPLFGFAAQSIEYEYFAWEASRLEEALKEQGYELVISSFDDDAAKQVDVMENFISMGIDAALIFPMDSVAISDVCKRAIDSGMIIISGGEDLGESMTALYNTDQIATAYGIVEMAKDYIDANFENEAVEIALLDNTATTAMATRREGFIQALAELLPDATIVSETEVSDTESAMAAAETILQQYPTTRIFVCYNDQVALGALEAIKGNGISDAAVFGSDATDQAIAELKSGTSMFKGTLRFENIDLAPFLIAGAKGEKIDALISPPAVKITTENVNDMA